MKTYIIIFLVPIIIGMSLKSMGQSNDLEWAPIGATWTYFESDLVGGGGPFTVTSLRDTFIEGRTCRYLANENREVEIILYEQNDTVFTYQDNQFRILYDFTAQPGDTVEIYTPLFECLNNTYPIRIDSIGTVSWQNLVLQVQWISNIEVEGCTAIFGSGEILEKTGNLGFLLPQSKLDDPPVASGLLAYSDSTCHRIFLDSSRTECFPNGGFYNTLCAYQANCDTTINVSSKKSLAEIPGIVLYPNPARDYIFLQSDQYVVAKIILSDYMGRVVNITHPLTSNEHILDLSHLPSGMYYLQAEIDQAWYSHKMQIQR